LKRRDGGKIHGKWAVKRGRRRPKVDDQARERGPQTRQIRGKL
jgi:hypothetical protein